MRAQDRRQFRPGLKGPRRARKEAQPGDAKDGRQETPHLAPIGPANSALPGVGSSAWK